MATPASGQEAETLAPNGWPRSLLDGFRAGDREALTGVYRLHADEVATLLRRGFGFEAGGVRRRFVGYVSAFELQDALHETFRRAFEPRARDGYDGIRPYGPYLRTIARNVVLKTFRAREVAFPVEDMPPRDMSVELGPVAPPAPDQAVARKQIQELVAAFVKTLPPADRELLRLRFTEGLSQREAAEQLGLGRQRIRTREARIRAGLLRHLRERGEGSLGTAAWPIVLGLLTEVLR